MEALLNPRLGIKQVREWLNVNRYGGMFNGQLGEDYSKEDIVNFE